VKEECPVGVAKEIKEKIFNIKYEIFFCRRNRGMSANAAPLSVVCREM
jgi:hypothetical protein